MPENSLSTASPVFDSQMVKIADYVEHFEIKSDNAYSNARLALLDALACGFLALPFPECVKMLGPIAPGTVVPNGARVPGTSRRRSILAVWCAGRISATKARTATRGTHRIIWVAFWQAPITFPVFE